MNVKRSSDVVPEIFWGVGGIFKEDLILLGGGNFRGVFSGFEAEAVLIEAAIIVIIVKKRPQNLPPLLTPHLTQIHHPLCYAKASSSFSISVVATISKMLSDLT